MVSTVDRTVTMMLVCLAIALIAIAAIGTTPFKSFVLAWMIMP